MDADDVCRPDRLERQLRRMESAPTLGLLGTQVRFRIAKRELPGPVKPLDHAEIGRLLTHGVYAICHASTLLRVSVARAIGGYRLAGAGQDLDFFLRMHEAAEVANLPDALYLIRIHDRSINAVAQGQVQLGRAYAIDCALRRRRGEPECTLTEFSEDWQRRSWPKRLHDAIDCWSVVQYRKAILELGQSHYLFGGPRLTLAALCRPAAVWRRVRRCLSTEPFRCRQQ